MSIPAIFFGNLMHPKPSIESLLPDILSVLYCTTASVKSILFYGFYLKACGKFFIVFYIENGYILIVGVSMIRRSVFCLVLMCIVCFSGFGQQAALIRDYVGMISQVFHPEIISFLEQLRDEHNRRGRSNLVRDIDNYLKGDSGSGFVYVANGKNYIITNFHVISQADTLAVTFEKPDGERTRYSGLTIVAADKDMDIALLAFPEGQNPFRTGMAFLTRPVQEGENVLSAGFPGFGNNIMLWQLGAGIISNSNVNIPDPDDQNKRFGPYIQHTAQVDPGNSGGPLLVQTPGVPTGYSVAGINTARARYRQAANFSIPMSRVQSFIDTSMRPPAEDDLTRLNARLDAFIEGLGASKAVYPHIAEYLSHACTGENVEYAITEVFGGASQLVQNDIFNRDIVDAMTNAVAWLIENNLRSKRGTISVTLGSVIPADNGRYTVSFDVNNTTVDSEWVNEYGIWRIRTFGDFASGDKTLVEKKKKAANDAKGLSEPSVRIGAGMAYVADLGASFGIDFRGFGNKYFGLGMQGIFGPEGFAQVDVLIGFYFPLPAGPVAFIPFGEAAVGLMVKENLNYDPDDWSYNAADATFMAFGLSLKGGLMFSISALRGLYLQTAFQYNFHRNKDWPLPPRSAFSVGLGYAF
jgi:serine protease Do